MSARPAPARAALPAHPLAVAGALLLAASELRYLADRQARGESMPPNLSRLLSRYARCCEEGAAELHRLEQAPARSGRAGRHAPSLPLLDERGPR